MDDEVAASVQPSKAVNWASVELVVYTELTP